MSEENIKSRLARFCYWRYRNWKNFALTHPDYLASRWIFRFLQMLRAILSKFSAAPKDSSQWKDHYLQRFGLPGVGPLFRVRTDFPVANFSSDHQCPRGAVYDNSANRAFNRRLYGFMKSKADLKVLDMGCAGGGFVRSILEDGFSAIGLEGSDVPRRLALHEWDTIPAHLFTVDIGQPFAIMDPAGNPLTFDCITAWEVLEHIPEDRLGCLLGNVVSHLAPGGIFVASIPFFPDADLLSGAVYHVTLHQQPWWEQLFARQGLVPVRDHPFQPLDFVRGHGQGFEWDVREGEGFHAVLTRTAPCEN